MHAYRVEEPMGHLRKQNTYMCRHFIFQMPCITFFPSYPTSVQWAPRWISQEKGVFNKKICQIFCCVMWKVILYFWIDICAGDLHWWKDGGSNWQTWPESSWELPKYCAGRRWTHPCWLHQHYHASKSSILCMSVEDNVLPMLTLFWVKDSATGLLDYCYQILSLHANAQSVITERRGHGCSSGYWWIWKNVTPLIWFHTMSLTIHVGGTFQSIEDCSASSGLFSCKNIQTVLS